LWYVHGTVNWKLRIASFLASHLFTTTKESLRIQSNKRHILGHGIDANLFCPDNSLRSKDEFVIASVGRISPIKDYETLIETFSLFASKYKKCRLIIAGGPGTPEQEYYYKKIQTLVAEKNLSNLVSFMGPVEYKDVPEILRGADVFAHTSKTGSLDKVVLEAMAAELLIVSSNESVAGIIPQGLKHLLLFHSGDAQELFKKIEGLYIMPREERGELGRSLREIVKKKHGISTLIDTLVSYMNYG